MGNRDIEEFYARAIRYGRQRGLGEEALDFAGWICLQRLEGYSLKQSMRHSLIDYFRSQRAHMATDKGMLKFRGQTRSIPILPEGVHDGPSLDLEQSLALHRAQPGPAYRSDVRIADYLEGRELEIYRMYAEEELTAREISRKLGISGARVGHILKEIVEKVRKQLKKR